MQIPPKQVKIYCIKRGHKDKLDDINSVHLEYIYCIDTNDLYLSSKKNKTKIERYEDLDILLLSCHRNMNMYAAIAIIQSELPKKCLDGQILLCIDTKKLYIGNDGAPKLVLEKRYETYSSCNKKLWRGL